MLLMDPSIAKMTREMGSCTPSGKRKRKTTTRSNNKRQCSGLRACSSSKKKKKNAQHLNPCSSSVTISPRRQVDWLELPREVMVLIFQRLGIVLTLTTAQLVCSHWRDIAKDPIFFRHILLQGEVIPECSYIPTVDALKFALFAVDRGRGHLVRFSCDVMLPFHKHHLHHIADSCTSSMKSLRLGYCPHVDPVELAKVINKIPSLEELHLYDFDFPRSTLNEIGRSCTKLKYFQLETVHGAAAPSDEEAFAIAESMPSLRRLRLLQNGNGLTNVGLQAIIDGCPCLEYIFLGQCSNIDLEGDLFSKCVRKIRSIRIDLVKKEHEFRFEVGDHLQSQVWGYDLGFSDDEYSEIYVEHDLYSQDQ